jgi:WD40 repeat protein
LAILANGESIVSVGDGEGVFSQWYAQTGKHLQDIPGPSGPIDSLIALSDGTSLVTEVDGELIVWSVDRFRERKRLPETRADSPCSGRDRVGATFHGTHMVLSNNHRFLVFDCDLQSPHGLRIRKTTEVSAPGITAIAMAPQRDLVAVASHSIPVRLWDRRLGKWIFEATASWQDVNSIKFSSDGDEIAIGTQLGLVRAFAKDDHNRWGMIFETQHHGPVERVEFSPDGSRLAVAGLDGVAVLWELRPDRRIPRLDEVSKDVARVSCSSQGDLIATGDKQGVIQWWDARSGALQRQLSGHQGAITGLCFAPNGDMLATTGDDGATRLWNISSSAPRTLLNGHTTKSYCVDFAPDGRSVASGGGDGTIRIWNLGKPNPHHVISGHADRVWCVSFSPDGQVLASASRDQTIRLWNAATGKLLTTLRGHKDGVFYVAFSPDGQTLASCGVENDATICLWDAANWKLKRRLLGHIGAIYVLKFSNDGKTLASSGQDQLIRLWDPVTGLERGALTAHKGWITSFDFSLNDAELVSASADGTVRRWRSDPVATINASLGRKIPSNLPSAAAAPVIMPWLPPVPCVPSSQIQRKITLSGTPTVYVFSPDASKIYVGFEEGTVAAYSVESGNELRQFGQSKSSRVESLAASPDGKYIVASNGGGTVQAWNIESGHELPLCHNQRNVRGVAFDASNHLLRLMGSSPSHVVVDMDSQEMISSTNFLEVMAGPRYSRSNGRLFAFGSGHQLCLLDAATSQITKRLSFRVHGLTFGVSSDGSQVAVAAEDTRRQLTLWNVDDNSHHSLHGHTSFVKGTVFTDRNELISTSWDGTVRFWDSRTREPLGMVHVLPAKLHQVALSPDQSILASASLEYGQPSSLLLWDLDSIRKRFQSDRTALGPSLTKASNIHPKASPWIGSRRAMRSGDRILLRTRTFDYRAQDYYYLSARGDVGRPYLRAGKELSDAGSDEIWWIELIDDNGQVIDGDLTHSCRVRLRSRVKEQNDFLYLRVGKMTNEVFLTAKVDNDIHNSDDLFYLERQCAGGTVLHGDRVNLRSTHKGTALGRDCYLQAPDGIGVGPDHLPEHYEMKGWDDWSIDNRLWWTEPADPETTPPVNAESRAP